MRSISQLEAQLRQFDGKHTDSLVQVANTLSPDAGTIDQLLSLVEQSDEPMQTAATWLLKQLHSRDTTFTPAQVTKCIGHICHSGSWESRLHVLQMLPDLTIPTDCGEDLFQSLVIALSENNRFIRAWVYTGLHTLASQHGLYAPEVVAFLERGTHDEAAAVRARLRQLKPLGIDATSRDRVRTTRQNSRS